MAQQNGKKPVSNLSSALASIHLSQQQQNLNNNNNNHAYSNDYYNEEMSHDAHYNMTHNIDIPMRPQASDFVNQMPVDRIAEYRKNPPTEGISLFSHRVS